MLTMKKGRRTDVYPIRKETNQIPNVGKLVSCAIFRFPLTSVSEMSSKPTSAGNLSSHKRKVFDHSQLIQLLSWQELQERLTPLHPK